MLEPIDFTAFNWTQQQYPIYGRNIASGHMKSMGQKAYAYAAMEDRKLNIIFANYKHAALRDKEKNEANRCNPNYNYNPPVLYRGMAENIKIEMGNYTNETPSK